LAQLLAHKADSKQSQEKK